MDKPRYALFGQPIELSFSPQIHSHFSESLKDEILYEKFEVSKTLFKQTVLKFFNEGGKGLNITVPHKQAAYQIAEVVSPEAEQAQAVNTLWMKQGKLHGSNTDGVGFINDCEAKGIELDQQKILILGAGGAVSGILAPLLEHKPQQLVIANRTLSKAQSISKAYSKYGAIGVSELTNIPELQFDIVINGLSTHDFPEGLNITLEDNAIYYDLKYGKAAESGINWAVCQAFSQISDGWGMLVNQAAQSYLIWRKQLPSVKSLIENPSIIIE